MVKRNKNRIKQRLINELSKELEESNLAIFAGAGLSVQAGFVNWSELLKPIAEEIDLDIDKETDLVTLAQYHCNCNQSNRGKLNQLLINEFSQKAKITDNHKILARLPISTYWTTNYDKMIENALADAGKVPDTKYRNQQLTFTKPKRDAIVYKMHGDVNHPGDAVLTKDDYESYHVRMQPFLNALSGDLISKTFLFLGFSFTDPNLDYILSRVRIAYSKDQRQHYCLQKCVSPFEKENQADFEYRERKQELFIQDLLRFGIKTILIDDYTEITEILVRLEQIHKRRTIFISGAANKYGKWNDKEAERFIYDLSKDIAKEGFRIVSGFGLGVGSSVITGVLEELYMSGSCLDNNQLIMRPFPQTPIGENDLKTIWREYRQDMISYAGVAIFLFGNKKKKGNIVESDGMKEEFEIAKKKKLLIIPVGLTGFISAKIWKELYDEGYFNNPELPEQIRNELVALGDESKTLNDARGSIINIVKLLNER